MSKALARLRLKFSKAKPESFNPNYRQIIGVKCEIRLQEERYQRLIEEIKKSNASEKAIVEPILSKMAELAKEVKSAVEVFSKPKLSQHAERRDLTKDIEKLLGEKGELTFTQILSALGTTAPTLGKHLDRLVSGGRVERRSVGVSVLYQLKNVNNQRIFRL